VRGICIMRPEMFVIALMLFYFPEATVFSAVLVLFLRFLITEEWYIYIKKLQKKNKFSPRGYKGASI
jgi:hypothetical protein